MNTIQNIDNINNYQNNSNNQNNQNNQNNRPILIYDHYLINVSVIGDRIIGKSELLNKFCELHDFHLSNQPKIRIKRFIKDDKYIKIRFHDSDNIITNDDLFGIVFVYDCTNYNSFKSIKEKYYKNYLSSRDSNQFVLYNEYIEEEEEEEEEEKEEKEEKEKDNNNNSDINDLNDKDNMDQLFFKVWRNNYLRNHILSFKKKDIVIKLLIGTKLDIKEKFNNLINKSDGDGENNNNNNELFNFVEYKEAKEFANKIGAKFYQVSNIDDLHIKEIFNEFSESVINNYEKYGRELVLNNPSIISNNNQTFNKYRTSTSTPPPPSINNLSSTYFKKKCTIN